MIITLESCKDLNDNEIVAKSRGNLDYFSCLYLRYEPELLRYIRRISRVDEEEARDILQESFIKIWRNLNEYDSGLKLSSWIYRIVHNEAVSFLRQQKSFGKNNKSDVKKYEDLIPEETEIDPEDKVLLTQKILYHLPMKYREVLILKFFEKKSYEEISDILKIPGGTVAIRINRAKQKFRNLALRKNEFK